MVASPYFTSWWGIFRSPRIHARLLICFWYSLANYFCRKSWMILKLILTWFAHGYHNPIFMFHQTKKRQLWALCTILYLGRVGILASKNWKGDLSLCWKPHIMSGYKWKSDISIATVRGMTTKISTKMLLYRDPWQYWYAVICLGCQRIRGPDADMLSSQAKKLTVKPPDCLYVMSLGL